MSSADISYYAMLNDYLLAVNSASRRHSSMTCVVFRLPLRDVLLNSASGNQNAMAHKICAAIHVLMPLALFGHLEIVNAHPTYSSALS
jgi:hypothetical protein